MTDKLFDNFFQDRLRDHSSPVPEGLWTKIEEELAPEKEDRKVLLFRRWYWAAAILVLALSSAAWLYWQHTGTTELTAGNKASGSNAAAIQKADQAENQPATSAMHPPVATPLSSNSSTTENTTTSKPADAATIEKQAVVGSRITAKKTETATYSNRSQIAVLSDRRNGRRRKVFSQPVETAPASIAIMQHAAKQKNLFANKANDNADASDNSNTTTYSPFATLTAEMAEIPVAEQTDYASALRLYMQKQENSFFPVIRCPPVRSTVPSDLYIEAYVSPDKVFRQISANNGATGYVTNRDTSLSLRTSFTAGVRFSKALTENLLLKAGVQYSQINENFNYRLENERKQITVVTTHTISNSPGDTVTVRDTSTYEQIGYLQKKVKNRYRNIDIPVLLSYEWGNDQWRFAINGGPIINLHSWYSGEMPDTTNQPVSVKGNNAVFKKNIGIGLYAGISIIKTINENMDLFAEPYFRYNLSDMTQKGQAFNQKFNTTGLSLGIRYRINGGQRY